MALRTKWLLAAAAMTCLSRVGAAQAPPFGPPYQVNSYTTSDQRGPAIASSGDGSFVIGWESYSQDGDKTGVFARPFSSAGVSVLPEFQVNTLTASFQYATAIGAGKDGFVVVWSSDFGDGNGQGIFGRRFDTDGLALGSQFQVNTYTTNNQYEPQIALDPSGNFVVVWTSSPQDGSVQGVFGQRFDASGAKAGAEFPVNTHTTGRQFLQSVAADRSGNFVVVWQGYGQDGSVDGILGQRFGSAGQKVGPEFVVNAYTTGNQLSPRVSMSPAGNFVVVWEDEQDPSDGVFGQRFNSSGERVGSEFRVNTYTPGQQFEASVAVDRSGGFTVVWSSRDQDGDDWGVFGQRFDLHGARVGSEFQVNTYTTDAQRRPAVADDGQGLVVTWESYKQDGSGRGIYARRQDFLPLPMRVDVHAGGGSISDVNGVLEPGETVIVEPVWTVPTFLGFSNVALAGTGSNPSGPPGPIYLLSHAAADYGSVNITDTHNCYDDGAAHECYLLGVAGTRPATHWDAGFEENLSVGGRQNWKVHVGGSFSDVPKTQSFYKKIETALHNGIAAGCTATKYCPGDPVSRGQMAIFLGRGIAGAGEYVPTAGIFSGSSYNCSPGGNSLFLDVLPTDSFCKHVHYIAAQSVTLGCATAQFCAGQSVSREQMASFIAKAVLAPGGGPAVPTTYTDPATALSYSCASASPNLHFTDVPVTNAFCKHIHYLWARGIIAGCTATQYCPTALVHRDAMAKFLSNGFGLELYGP